MHYGHVFSDHHTQIFFSSVLLPDVIIAGGDAENIGYFSYLIKYGLRIPTSLCFPKIPFQSFHLVQHKTNFIPKVISFLIDCCYVFNPDTTS